MVEANQQKPSIKRLGPPAAPDQAKSGPEDHPSSLPQELKDLVAGELVEQFLQSGSNHDMRDVLSLQGVSLDWREAVNTQPEFKKINALNRDATKIADMIYEKSAGDNCPRQAMARQNGPHAGLLKQSSRDKMTHDILHQENKVDQARDIFAWAPHMGQMDEKNRNKLLAKAVDIYAENIPPRGEGPERSFAPRDIAAGALQIAHEFLTVDHKVKIEDVRTRSDLDAEAFAKGYYPHSSPVINQLVGSYGQIHHPYRPKESKEFYFEQLQACGAHLEGLNAGAVAVSASQAAEEREVIAQQINLTVRFARRDLSDPSKAPDLQRINSEAEIFARQIYREAKDGAADYESEGLYDGPLAARAKQIAPVAGLLEKVERKEIASDILAERDKVAQASALANLAPGLGEFEDTHRKPLLDKAEELFAKPPPREIKYTVPLEDWNALSASHKMAAAALQIAVSHLTKEQSASIERTYKGSKYHRHVFTTAFLDMTQAVVMEAEGQRGIEKHPNRASNSVAEMAEDLHWMANPQNEVVLDGRDGLPAEIARDGEEIADVVSRFRNEARLQLLAQSRERRGRDGR
ncbi:hypothetical protein HFN63_35610 [Rhizobium leguminosarum]|uniref:hypothetical protein n=1 Tax=Rhizobium leguminosarum TaxID=384 RepID=UPI001C9647DF|nr:hypothetical protein [Rhizobium leguminosarum]MBY5775279.1 hypothetical protein [Rhizobium leguminosarum]